MAGNNKSVDKNDAGDARHVKRAGPFEFFPVTALPVLAYILLAQTKTTEVLLSFLGSPSFTVNEAVGAEGVLTNAHIFIVAAITALFVEIMRATHNNTRTVPNHILSIIVFGGCIYLITRLEHYQTITFAVLLLISLFDVAAGVVVSLRSRLADPKPTIVKSRVTINQ